MSRAIQIYLDMNIFKRNFDDLGSLRIRLEVAAIDVIFAYVSLGKYEFPWSFILEYENNLNPNLQRRTAAVLLSQKAAREIEPSEMIRDQARKFEEINIKSRDALHLACAESTGCDYFLTCDDKLIKKSRQLNLQVKVMEPVGFVNLMEHQDGH